MHNKIPGPQLSHVAIQHAKAAMPFRATLMRLKRAMSPYQTDRGNDGLALQQGLEQIRLLREHHGPLEGKVVLEVGTGWQPTIPVLFSLAGCARIYLTDVERLMDYSLVIRAMSFVRQHADTVGPALGMTPRDVLLRLGTALEDNLDGVLENLRMRYLAPFEPGAVESGSVDVIYSRAVLEHIARRTLHDLTLEFARMLASDGAMCHVIDNSDHWEHSDKRLSRINYLRYSPFAWRLINPAGQGFQNRLRHSEYLAFFQMRGFDIAHESTDVDERALQDAKALPLWRGYAGFEPADLAAMTSYIVARLSA